MGIQGNRGEQALKDQIAAIRKMRLHGVGVFSYENLFPSHQPNNLARLLKKKFFSEKARIAGRKYPDAVKTGA